MVIQRDVNTSIWGWAAPGTIITTVDYMGQGNFSTTANGNEAGFFRLNLPAVPLNALSQTITIVGTDGTSIQFEDVLFGDVYLASGQSNMGLPVSVLWNVTDVINAAVNYPTLRLFQAPGNAESPVPLNNFPTDGLYTWQTPLNNGSTSNNRTLLGYSAAAYLFGASLYDHFKGTIPIGIVLSAHGGTSILTWQSPASVYACGDISSDGWNASELYNSNIYPLTLGPLQFKGALYYQGEEDVGIGNTESFWRTSWYMCSLTRMIADWRTVLQQPTLPFVIQQLHAWIHTVNTTGISPGDFGLALFRQMQAQVARTVPNVGLSVAFDGGDPATVMYPINSSSYSPSGTVHPHDKYIPGLRLSRTMVGLAYPDDPSAIPYLYPTYSHAVPVSTTINNGTSTNITVTVYLDNLTGEQGKSSSALTIVPYEALSNSSHCPTERGVNMTYCDWFAIMVNDAYPLGTWYNASVSLGDNNASLVLNVLVPRGGLAPVATRNGYSDWPVTTVYTTDGLPVLTWLKPLTT